jgi:hypothetical protein
MLRLAFIMVALDAGVPLRDALDRRPACGSADNHHPDSL